MWIFCIKPHDLSSNDVLFIRAKIMMSSECVGEHIFISSLKHTVHHQGVWSVSTIYNLRIRQKGEGEFQVQTFYSAGKQTGALGYALNAVEL